MKKYVLLSALLALAIILAGCNGVSSPSSTNPQNTQAQIFTTAEDAPVSSVVAINITINRVTLNNSSTTVQLLSTPVAVDFGRLVGLRSLLGFNTIAPGTYTSATVTFEGSAPAPTANYINLTTNPPSISMATGILSSSTVTVSFPAGKPLVVTGNGLAGLHMDFNLRKSLAVDGSGNLIV